MLRTGTPVQRNEPKLRYGPRLHHHALVPEPDQATSPDEFGKVLKVHSEQDTPLNLELGEELLSYVWKSVLAYMETKRHEFDEEHTCYEGVSDPDSATACPHLDDDAARVDVRVSNNLGPAYDHLQREYHSQVTIFREEDLQDSSSL